MDITKKITQPVLPPKFIYDSLMQKVTGVLEDVLNTPTSKKQNKTKKKTKQKQRQQQQQKISACMCQKVWKGCDSVSLNFRVTSEINFGCLGV